MKIQEVIEKMDKQPLGRIVKSVGLQQFGNIEKRKEQITANLKSFIDEEKIIDRLSIESLSEQDKEFNPKQRPRILSEIILRKLLETPKANEDEIIEYVKKYEKTILEIGRDIELDELINKEYLNSYKELLKVALDDGELTTDEYKLIEKYRKYKKINKRISDYIEVKIKKYPRNYREKKKQQHTEPHIHSMLKILQKKGIVFKFKDDGKKSKYTIPDELRKSVKKAIEYEMNEKAHKKLLNDLKRDQLISIAKGLNIKGYSGLSKKKLEKKLLRAGYKPSKEIDILKHEELTNICSKLSNVIKTGSKDELIKRIVNHFSRLKLRKPKTTDDREKYYLYLEKIAARKTKELIDEGVINKSEDCGKKFEKGTIYIFDKILKLEVEELGNQNQADGKILFGDEILLWDNKSKLNDGYKFVNADLNQFKRYINGSKKRVKVFLIIVPSFQNKESAKAQADKLKNKVESDTDVALITAKNLKYIAEELEGKSDEKLKFDLAIFNYTGIIEKNRIERYINQWNK